MGKRPEWKERIDVRLTEWGTWVREGGRGYGYAPESLEYRIWKYGAIPSAGKISNPTEAAFKAMRGKQHRCQNVESEVRRFPMAWRAVLDGVYVQQHTQEMVAKNINVTQTKVSVRLDDAMAELRDRLDERKRLVA